MHGIFVGGICNNNCEFCQVREMQQFVPTDAILKAAENERQVRLFGGEPTLRKDLPKIVEKLAEAEVQAVLRTNGMMLKYKNYVNILRDAGLKEVEIKIVSLDPKLHNSVTKNPNSWSATVAGIKNTINEGMDVTLVIPLLKKNHYEIPHIVKWGRGLGAKRIIIKNMWDPKMRDQEVALSILRSNYYAPVEIEGFPARYALLANKAHAAPENIELRKAELCKNCAIAEICRGVLNNYVCKEVKTEKDAIAESFERNIPIYEVIQLVEGIRDAWLVTYKPETLEILLSAKRRRPLEAVAEEWELGAKPEVTLFVHNSREKVLSLAKGYISPETREEIQETVGNLLQYPKCCVEHHLEWSKLAKNEDEFDANFAIVKNTKKPHWELNFFYNFQTRINSAEEFALYNKYAKINSEYGIRVQHLSLIPWIPHALDCQKSLEIARKTYRAMCKHLPKFCVQLRDVLQKPIIIFDKWVWATIVPEEISSDENTTTIKVKDVLPPYSPIEPPVGLRGATVIWERSKPRIEMNGKKYKGFIVIFSNFEGG